MAYTTIGIDGDILRTLHARYQLTNQNEIASLAGVSLRTWLQWCREGQANKTALFKLARALNEPDPEAFIRSLQPAPTQQVNLRRSAVGPVSSGTPLWSRIARDRLHLRFISDMRVVTSACAAAATEFLRNPRKPPYFADPGYYRLLRSLGKNKNQSTHADFGAQIMGLLVANSLLSNMARRLGAALAFTGEETASESYIEFLTKYLDDARFGVMSADVFYDWLSSNALTIGLVLDVIDGTVNFLAGLEEWGSTATLFVEGTPRISVAYLPAKHWMVVSVLPGPRGREWEGGSATLMNSLTGYEEDLGKRFRMGWGAKLNSVTLAHHITRAKGASGENKADVYMPVFNNLHNASKGTYAYNCGIYSAIQVVRGVVGGYINSHMPPHDACHIYALVAAAARSPDCVTTLSGGPVRWDSSDRIGLVAASPAVRKQIVQEISRAGVREVAEHGAMSRKSKRNRNPSDQPASPPLATA